MLFVRIEECDVFWIKCWYWFELTDDKIVRLERWLSMASFQKSEKVAEREKKSPWSGKRWLFTIDNLGKNTLIDQTDNTWMIPLKCFRITWSSKTSLVVEEDAKRRRKKHRDNNSNNKHMMKNKISKVTRFSVRVELQRSSKLEWSWVVVFFGFLNRLLTLKFQKVIENDVDDEK